MPNVVIPQEIRDCSRRLRPRNYGRPPGSRRAHEGPSRAELAIAGADLSYPDPRLEAKACLKIARTNGGVEKMRETIRVTTEEQQALHRMADLAVLSPFLVLKSLEYRAAVLREFDKLLDR